MSTPAAPLVADGWDEHGTPIVTPKPEPAKEKSLPDKADASATSKPAEKQGEKSTPADGKAPESGTGKHKAAKDADDRIQELLRERKEARERADRLEAELAEARKPKPASDDKKAESSPAAELKAPERPKRPRLDQFSTTDEYETAMDKYEEAMFEFPKKLAEFERNKAQADQRKTAFEAKQKKLNITFIEANKQGKEIYGEEWEKAAMERTLPINDGSPVLEYLGDCEPITAAHLWQYFGLNRKDLERINGLSYRAQMKELAALEEAISEEISGGNKTPAVSARKKADKTEKAEKPVEVKPRAPKPPSEVGGRGAATEDADKAAARDGNFGAFDAAQRAKHFRAS